MTTCDIWELWHLSETAPRTHRWHTSDALVTKLIHRSTRLDIMQHTCMCHPNLCTMCNEVAAYNLWIFHEINYIHCKFICIYQRQITYFKISDISDQLSFLITKFDNNIHYKIRKYSLMKSHLKMPSAKYYTFWSGTNVGITYVPNLVKEKRKCLHLYHFPILRWISWNRPLRNTRLCVFYRKPQ